jgi:hypothetical protein
MKYLPKISIFIVLIASFWYSLDIEYWKRTDRIISSDVLHYYAYLPAVFIYKDIELKYVTKDPNAFQTKVWPMESPLGKNTIMTSMGMSIMYTPAFLSTYLYMQLTGQTEDDGYGPPYRLGLVIGTLVYLFLAMLLLKKTLIQFFDPLPVALTVLIIGLGTNLFHYTTAEATMSHAYSFFLFAAFLYLTVAWHSKPGFKLSIIIGLVSGMIVLVRPTNVIIGLVFLLWGVTNFGTLKEKIRLYTVNYKLVVYIILFAILVWIPQIIYWKQLTGMFFFKGYGSDQGFFFNNPQIFNSLFSYRKGWLVYTPAMILSFIGLILMMKKLKGIAIPLIVFTVLNVYIISSWWSWWYGGGFGHRAYVESYALFSVGFAALFQWVFGLRKWFISTPTILLVCALIALNLFQTRQYYFGSIHYVGMTKEAYWHSFLKLKIYGDYYYKLTIPDMKKARTGIYEYEYLVPPKKQNKAIDTTSD